MPDERQQERRQALFIILVALVVAIVCWVPIGLRLFYSPSPSVPPATETPATAPKE